MSITLSCFRVFVLATAGALAGGCSGVQTPSSIAPALHETMADQAPLALGNLRSQKCQHSRWLQVVPCRLTLRGNRTREIYVEGGGSGITRLFDNCQGLAKVANESGPAYIVIPRKAQGTCVAVFTNKREFAIITIHNELPQDG
ncbi:MAG: hypothetical protein WB615_09885 [Candidatus Tumulicola sp.]